MKIIGFDSAVQEKNIGLVLCNYENGVLTLEDKKNNTLTSEKQILIWSANDESIIMGIDSPLGWPAGFGLSLKDHIAGNNINIDATSFFERETDKFIYKTFKKKPLEVSADRIARTAYYTLNRINTINNKIATKYEILWNHNNPLSKGFIEVYPAATLLANEIEIKGYKDNKNCRERILEELKSKYNFVITQNIDITTIDHDFDAFICCLAIHDFIQRNVYFPDNQINKYKTEGWIWTKRKIT